MFVLANATNQEHVIMISLKLLQKVYSKQTGVTNDEQKFPAADQLLDEVKGPTHGGSIGQNVQGFEL